MPIHHSVESLRLKTAAVLSGLIFILLLSSGLNARQNQLSVTPKHCLWEIKTPANKVFLLGSLHLLKSDAYPLASAINKAYRHSSRVVFETDIGALEEPAVQARMLSMAIYPEGQNLLQHISPDMQKALKKKRIRNAE